MKEWTEKVIERAENVVYLVVAAILLLIAAAVLVQALWSFSELFSRDVADVAIEVLDLLLLVFIVVELLFAVRTTLSRRELVAEPFILVGIIASLKEIVVLSVKAPDLLGKPEFDDMIWLIGVLTATIVVLSVAGFLLRRKEREPSEAARSGNEGLVDRDGEGPLDEDPAGAEPDEQAQERRAAAGRA
ncbi:MAG TPA: phosphate-starvation-inducible PsiE family protein [Pedococcus sp.]|jgi:uncharacterized membrane protein (DUF373 family)